MTTLYIIEFGNVLINEYPSDIDDVDSIWFGVMSYDTGIDFEERLICSKTKKKTNKHTICQHWKQRFETVKFI